MNKVGLSGGIGSGKSTVAAFWRTLGIPVYESDIEARRIMTSHEPTIQAISELFGSQAYIDGHLNREHIASLVFSNPDLLQKLNEIVHPAVQNDFIEWSNRQDAPYIIEETALLFDGGQRSIARTMDFNVVVTASLETRIKRACLRDNSSREKIMARIDSQMPQQKMIELSDFCIDNDAQLVIPQIIAIDRAIRNSLHK